MSAPPPFSFWAKKSHHLVHLKLPMDPVNDNDNDNEKYLFDP